MDLTVIRDHVYRQLSRIPNAPKVDPFDIDDAVNYIQDTYIQPVWFSEGEAFYTTRGKKIVTGEDNTLDVTNKIYTATYKPFQRGTVTVYADGVESDAAFAVDYTAGTVTFVLAQTASITLDYTALEVVALTDLAGDIYEIDFIRDITDGLPGYPITVVDADNTMYSTSSVIQKTEDNLYLLNIGENRILKIAYWQKLTVISATNATPEIPDRWHNLYWMGAIAQFDLNKMLVFLDRLAAFEKERRKFTNTRAYKVELIW